ncbi:hypothetical protein ACHAXR_004823 [Thalassiosira sp. AJA248-18]
MERLALELKEKHIEEVSELQSTIDAVSQQLKEAGEKWDSRPSLPNDEQRIKSLEHEVKTLSITERQTREKMLYFKRELENRETNFNMRFRTDAASTNGSPLRVIQKQERTGKQPGNATTRRKVRGKAGAGTRKKKATTSSKLPKISK